MHPVEQVLAKGFDLATLAAMATVAVIVASLFEKRAAGVYHNSVAVLDANP